MGCRQGKTMESKIWSKDRLASRTFLSVDRSTIENKTQPYVMEKISFSEENFQWGQFSPSILHFQQINLQ